MKLERARTNYFFKDQLESMGTKWNPHLKFASSKSSWWGDCRRSWCLYHGSVHISSLGLGEVGGGYMAGERGPPRAGLSLPQQGKLLISDGTCRLLPQ